jgi:hypothetical protein
MFHPSPKIDTHRSDMTKSYADSHLVDVELNSPDRILARSEPWNATDPDDCDRHLDPEDTDETIDANGIKGIPRDALGQLLRFLLPVTSKPGRWKMAAIRLAVISRILNIDDLGKLPLETLANQLGVTRSLLSLRQLEVADQYGLGKLRSSKSAAARKNYSTSATNAHRRMQERRQATAGNLTHKSTAASL